MADHERRTILPELALLHRLCEARCKRLDPRTLLPMLPLLPATGDSVQITCDGLYAAIDLSPEEAGQRSERAVSELQALVLDHTGHPLARSLAAHPGIIAPSVAPPTLPRLEVQLC